MTPRVVAVVVAHNGERWLDRTLGYLSNQTRPPDQTFGVDLGSEDRSAQMLLDSGYQVLQGSVEQGIGDAVDAALAADGTGGSGGDDGWVWILHDDSAPQRMALSELLRLAGSDPRTAVVGPKLKHWNDMHLHDMGLTCDLTGYLYENVRRDNVDRGQHDEPRSVLAVNSAGALIRRDVWQQIGGFDSELRRNRDELDFGWRVNRAGYRVRLAPEAVVLHAAAANTRLRRSAGIPARREREGRWGALYTVLTNLPLAMFVLVWLRLFAGQIMRATAQLVVKRSRDRALDEAFVAGRLVRRMPVLLRVRSRKQHHAAVSHAQIRGLLAKSRHRWAVRVAPLKSAWDRAWLSERRRAATAAIVELNEFLVVAVLAALLPLGLLDLLIHQKTGHWASAVDLVGHGQGLALCAPLFAQGWYASVTTRWPAGGRPAASRALSWLAILGLLICVYLLGVADSEFSEGRDLPKQEQERIARATEITLTFAVLVSAAAVSSRALLRAQRGSE